MEVPATASVELPSREAMAAALGRTSDRSLGILRMMLMRFHPEGSHEEHLVVVEQLGRFVMAAPRLARNDVPQHQRLQLLVEVIEKIPEAKRRILGCLDAVLGKVLAVKLFAEVGQPNDRGLWAETTDRLSRRVLPEAPDVFDLAALAGRIIRATGDITWLTPDEDVLLRRLGDSLGDAFQQLRPAAADAMGLVATRLAALGMHEQVRARSPREAVRDSPFYRLGRASPDELPALVPVCRERLKAIHQELEHSGVSVALVYSLDAIERGLGRLERLHAVAHSPTISGAQIRELLELLGRGLIGERSFRRLMSDNLRLLARKVIERAGNTGEHYVTATRRQYWHMLGSAFGGGVLTAGTAITKFLIKWSHFPLFIDGMVTSLLFAVSFLAIQAFGFTLATKQPSMTAAALAGTLRRGDKDHVDLLRLIAQIARSQFAAAIGNILGVIVIALGFDVLFQYLAGHPFLDAGRANAVVESFDPLHSGTLLFAALTGVLLWLSSLAGGWFENWFVYRRLPAAIAAHRFGKRLGRQRMQRFANTLERNATGIGGNVALGFALGLTPVFAQFVGLPLDVRHVTLSTGSLMLAVTSLGASGVTLGAFMSAAIGIVLIGILNFGVSFALALIVALRARDVPRGESRTLPGQVIRHFFRNPLRYVFPPREDVRGAALAIPTDVLVDPTTPTAAPETVVPVENDATTRNEV